MSFNKGESGGGGGAATGVKRSLPRNYKVGFVFLRKTLLLGLFRAYEFQQGQKSL